MRRLAIALTSISILAACTGAIGEDEAPPGGTAPGKGAPGGSGTPSQPACTSDAIEPGPTPIRRLTRLEYAATIRDLLGEDVVAGLDAVKTFPADQTVLGFDNNVSGLTVTTTLAEQYMLVAEKLSLAAAPKAKMLAGCDATPQVMAESMCARKLVERLGRRAFRRPLHEDEVTMLLAAFAARPEPTFESGAQTVIQLVLQSPWFLYRAADGSIPTDKPGLMRLDSHEIASRLSYLLWGTMPDDALFAIADAGKLGTKEEIALEARRMMNDPRAKVAVANFHRQWLELDALEEIPKDAKVYPEFDDVLRADLRTETATFVDHVFWKEGGMETLFTAPYTFANANLARVYGLAAPSGSGFLQVNVDASKRVGLLGQPSVLSLHAIAYESSPIYRGKFVRERLLCHDLPPPPESIEVVPPEVDPTKSTRERYSEHSSNPACRGCHQLMDPIGFGFEHYDGMGRYREKEGTHPIDAKGELLMTDVDGTYDGAIELSKKLAKSKQVSSCVVTHWFRFAYGRSETELDGCSLQSLTKSFAEKGYDMRELVVALTQTDAFRFRKVTP